MLLYSLKIELLFSPLCYSQWLKWARTRAGTDFLAPTNRQQAVQFGTGQRAVMLCSREGNRRSGVALAMWHRLQCFIHLRAQRLWEGDEHPTYAPEGMVDFTKLPPCVPGPQVYFTKFLLELWFLAAWTLFQGLEYWDSLSIQHLGTEFRQPKTKVVRQCRWPVCPSLTTHLYYDYIYRCVFKFICSFFTKHYHNWNNHLYFAFTECCN